jgi:hypothetical protein
MRSAWWQGADIGASHSGRSLHYYTNVSMLFKMKDIFYLIEECPKDNVLTNHMIFTTASTTGNVHSTDHC